MSKLKQSLIFGNIEQIKLLINYDNINNLIPGKDDYECSETPLQIVCRYGHYDCVVYLIENGAKQKNDNIYCGCLELLGNIDDEENAVLIVNYLLNHEPYFNVDEYEGTNIMHNYVGSNKQHLVEALLKYEKTINNNFMSGKSDSWGTPYQLALNKKNVAMIDLFHKYNIYDNNLENMRKKIINIGNKIYGNTYNDFFNNIYVSHYDVLNGPHSLTFSYGHITNKGLYISFDIETKKYIVERKIRLILSKNEQYEEIRKRQNISVRINLTDEEQKIINDQRKREYNAHFEILEPKKFYIDNEDCKLFLNPSLQLDEIKDILQNMLNNYYQEIFY